MIAEKRGSLATLKRPGSPALAVSIIGFVALAIATVGAASSPLIRVVDLPQYGGSSHELELCFAGLTSPRPACPYVRPAHAGASLPGVETDWARIAALGLTGSEATLLEVADRLVANQEGGRWIYHDRVRLAESTLEPPWVNASAQGLGTSVLARAWASTGNTRYRDALVAAAGAMPTTPEGWPETLPDGSGALAGGLNGLLGWWDAWRVTGDQVFHDRAQRAALWLETHIGRYDRDFVVLYALGPHDEPTSADLLHYTTGQLEIVGTISGRDSLSAVAREWQWRVANPGAFRLNLFLNALLQQPSTWIAMIAALAYLASLVSRFRAAVDE